MKIRYKDRTYVKKFLAGGRRYAPDVRIPDSTEDVQAIELAMRPVRLFGVIGRLDIVFLPPWLVAYLLIAIPFVPLIKRVCHVY